MVDKVTSRKHQRHRPRVDPAHVSALRLALSSALDQAVGEAFTCMPARQHLQRATEGLTRFASGGNVLALRDAAVSVLSLLELALRARRLDGHEQLAEGVDRTITLDPESMALVENAARSGGVTAAEVVRRAVAFDAGPILGALAEAQK